MMPKPQAQDCICRVTGGHVEGSATRENPSISALFRHKQQLFAGLLWPWISDSSASIRSLTSKEAPMSDSPANEAGNEAAEEAIAKKRFHPRSNQCRS